jgi:hypothetical protein
MCHVGRPGCHTVDLSLVRLARECLLSKPFIPFVVLVLLCDQVEEGYIAEPFDSQEALWNRSPVGPCIPQQQRQMSLCHIAEMADSAAF